MEEIDIEVIRKKTSDNLKGPVIEPFICAINNAIHRAAEEGKRSIEPWDCISRLRGLSPSDDARKAIAQYYVSRGFELKDHPNPDPGHPASRSFTTLSW